MSDANIIGRLKGKYGVCYEVIYEGGAICSFSSVDCINKTDVLATLKTIYHLGYYALCINTPDRGIVPINEFVAEID